jgi:hypothetical protein
VGAILADGVAHDSGLVYAYREDSNEDWHEVAAITASDGFEGQTFGSGVDVSGGCIIVGASTDDDQGQFAGAAYIYCGIPQLIFLVELDIICCIEIPDFTTGPVEFEIRFENVLSQAQTVRWWVDLVHPDGTVEQLIAPSETRVLPGTTFGELLEPTLRTAAAGAYAIVVYWDDGEGIHSEFQTISVVQSSLPGLSLTGLLILAALLLGVGHRFFIAQRFAADRTP